MIKIKCIHCNYEWKPKKLDVRCCPMCKQYLDREAYYLKKGKKPIEPKEQPPSTPIKPKINITPPDFIL